MPANEYLGLMIGLLTTILILATLLGAILLPDDHPEPPMSPRKPLPKATEDDWRWRH